MKTIGVIAAIIFNDSGELLVMEHNKLNAVTIPLGTVNDGESPDDTLIREMQEELNIEVLQHTLKYNFTIVSDCNEINLNVYLYTVLKYEGTIVNKEPTKHAAIWWGSEQFIAGIDRKGGLSKILHYGLKLNIFQGR